MKWIRLGLRSSLTWHVNVWKKSYHLIFIHNDQEVHVYFECEYRGFKIFNFQFLSYLKKIRSKLYFCQNWPILLIFFVSLKFCHTIHAHFWTIEDEYIYFLCKDLFLWCMNFNSSFRVGIFSLIFFIFWSNQNKSSCSTKQLTFQILTQFLANISWKYK